MRNTTQMFKELVEAGIIMYGGGNGSNRCSFSAGVTYSETFAKCYTGIHTIDSYDDLEDLYNKWVSTGKTWEGVVAWLSVKEGCLPLYWYVDEYKKNGVFDWDSLNLPENPSNDFYRKMLEDERKEFTRG